MNCGLCRDCKWWEKETAVYEIESELGFGHCLKAELDRRETKAMAMSQHDEPCLVTAPDFGCVQFEAK